MSRQSSAWMPLYVGDYLGDTQRLTTEQHGAYLLLILDYWRNGPPPDDDAVLQQIVKLDARTWKRHRPALARLFNIAESTWRHKRIDRELARAEENAERRSSKAQKAAQARWGDATGNAPSMPQALLGECPPQSPSSREKDANASSSKTRVPDPPPFEPDELLTAWNEMAGRAGLPTMRQLNDARRKAIRARIREFPRMDDWQTALDAVERSPFCRGERNGFRANIDFMLRPGNFLKLLEGGYDDGVSQRRH